jgi:hypothetical protein
MLLLNGRAAEARDLGSGVMFGLSRTTLSTSQAQEPGFGLAVSGYADLRLFERVRLRPEVGFVRKSAHPSLTAPPATLRFSVTVDDVEVPVLLAREILAAGPGRLYLAAGGFGAYHTRRQLALTIEEVEYAGEASGVSRWDFGLAGGLGYERTRGTHAWLVDLRYEHGLTDVIEGDSGIKTRTLVLRAGFRW